MYQEKMVVCLKNNGKILREKEGVIQIPFGSEYSIYIKNMESRKAKVKIQIDGEDVLNGQSLLINPNDTTELEGFLNDCIAKNKFKFIPKTQEISEFRGDKIDDGLVRIEFTYEKQKPMTQKINYQYGWDYRPSIFNNVITSIDPTWVNNPTFTTSTSLLNCNYNSTTQTKSLMSSDISNISQHSLSSQNISAQNCGLDSFDNGITVRGSKIKQEFKSGNIGELEEQSHVIILKLQGINDIGKDVEKIITVRDKLQCRTCGKFSKSDAKFCDRCGTYLE